MHPKLKPDAYWVPNPDGVTFVHVSGYLNVKGRSALALMNRLAPYLDGSNDLDTLVAGLEGGKREMVTTLVSALTDAGLIKDASGDAAHTLTTAEVEIYAAEIAYIDYFQDSAAARFERYRNTPTLVLGSGLTLTALVYAALRGGLADVTIGVTDECATDRDRIAEHLAAAASRDSGQRVQVVDVGADDVPRRIGELAERVNGPATGLVLHISDAAVPHRFLAVDALTRELGLTAVHGYIDGDEAWTGPVVSDDALTWSSVWHRLVAGSETDRGGHAPPSDLVRAPGEFLAGPTAGIVANRVAFDAFRHLTGIGDAVVADEPRSGIAADGRGSLARVDLETLLTTEHRVHAHPLATAAVPDDESAVCETVGRLVSARMPSTEEFSQLAARTVDPALGLLCDLDEEELTQLPICVARVRLSDPFGVLPDGREHPRVVGLGDDAASARHDAARRALAGYAALAVDRRRLSEDGRQAYAVNLGLDKPELIDAALAHPATTSSGPATAAWRAPRGLSWGETGAAALCRGLAEHVCAITLAELVAGQTSGARPVVAGDSTPPALTRYLHLLDLAGAPTSIVQVTGALGLPVYVGRRDDDVLCAGAELVDVLRRLLAHGQGVDITGMSDGGAGLPDLAPALTRSLAGPTAEPAVAQSDPLPDWKDLLAGLGQAGWQSWAVPLTHDPVVVSALPTAVQVLVGE